jgi:hypothetical protein
MAAEFGSSLVAELFEMHAELCERNAASMGRRRGYRDPEPQHPVCHRF